ncbi:MAG: peptide-methionine (S)-S-oxide reductase MsrA [Pseudomonadota bacterium]
MEGSLRVEPGDFPDPEFDPLAEGEGVAVLAGGCFWCTEAVFKELDGLLSVRPGYAGDVAEKADYRAVCSGATNHAEAIEVRYDPKRLTFGQILKIFFSVAHDPTQLNRQGNDRGRQYRSAVFYGSDNQKAVAKAYLAQLGRARVFGAPIVTTLEPLNGFYVAEDCHHDYAARNPMEPYVVHVSRPKVEKLRRHFGDKLRSDKP